MTDVSRAFETKGFCYCVLFLKVEECNVARVCIIGIFHRTTGLTKLFHCKLRSVMHISMFTEYEASMR